MVERILYLEIAYFAEISAPHFYPTALPFCMPLLQHRLSMDIDIVIGYIYSLELMNELLHLLYGVEGEGYHLGGYFGRRGHIGCWAKIGGI